MDEAVSGGKRCSHRLGIWGSTQLGAAVALITALMLKLLDAVSGVAIVVRALSVDLTGTPHAPN